MLQLPEENLIRRGFRFNESLIGSEAVWFRNLPRGLRFASYSPKGNRAIRLVRSMHLTKPATPAVFVRWEGWRKTCDLLVYNDSGVTFGDLIDEIHGRVALYGRLGRTVRTYNFEITIGGGVFVTEEERRMIDALETSSGRVEIC